MLKRLVIRNYALIEELSIEFSPQLTIITGETGAGKSILLGALGLIMGDRADAKSFYNQEDKCVVEGVFDVSAYDLQPFFEENELDYDDEVYIRREVSPAGKSRAFINDTPVNNQLLRRLTEVLVDMHQQFDVLDIHNVNFQLRMIDALADNPQRLREYQQAFRRYSADQKQLAALIEESESGAREMDYLRFQLEELSRAELVPGEQEELEAELLQLTNAEEIKRTTGAAYALLADNEQSLLSGLQEIGRSLAPLRKIAKPLDDAAQRLESAMLELEEIARDCERIAEQTEFDPARIHEIQERLDLIYKLQKKHACNKVEELLELQAQLENRLGGFADLGEQIASLQVSIQQQETALWNAAGALRDKRQAVIPQFEERVRSMLALLAMPHARLQVQCEPSGALSASGADDVQFLFASNLGSRFLPIKDVASGGELSRLTLCTKSLVADAIPLPTLIFDEIDSGVSGDVSLKMGQILKELSARHQVVCITHTPQVAARADRHYFVYKKVEGERTATHVRQLSEEERVKSIAVMLSGNPPGEAALTTARELIKG